MDTPTIGIDLGTTNTCVAVVKNGRVDVIANEQGLRTFPSMVCFSDEGTLVGISAKHRGHVYPERTIYEVKRIIGGKFSDPNIQKKISEWPYEIVDKKGNPAIRLSYPTKTEEYYPEQISAMVLKHAKTIAETHLGCSITRAVVTVPAYFNNSQRQATKDAAEIAGLKLLRIINEPTAAAIAYGWENKSDTERTVLVYDLGGGTFDVSIVHIDGNNYKVKATSGDTYLGGGDFDGNMVEHLANHFQNQYGTDLRKDIIAMRRLRNKCEEIKEKLSFNNIFNINIELASIYQDKDILIDISRIQFEQLNNHLFQRTIEIVDSCMKDAKLTKSDITDIVLVGGSTRIPKIQELLKEYFDGKNLMKSINPDEAVAYGAAIQASILYGEKTEFSEKLRIEDVTSLSLGTEVYSGEMVVLIKRNTPIPCKVSKDFKTVSNNQISVNNNIYQGERKFTKENIFLGTFTIDNLPPRPAGEVKFTDTFSLDDNGILHVDSIVNGTDLKGNIDIRLEENRLPKEEVNRLVKEAAEREIEDERKIQLNQSKYELESYCFSTKIIAENNIAELGADTSTKIITTCDNAMHEMKQIDDVFKVKDLLEEIKSICQSLTKKY